MCPNCDVVMTGIEYSYDNPQHYDGISEWRCETCGMRIGRWSGKELRNNEPELRFGWKP